MAATVGGVKTWTCTRDSEGHRTYKQKVRVYTNDPYDGPAVVLQAPNLSQPGDIWLFGNDIDVWAFCLPDATVTPMVDNEINREWEVEHTFTTKPPDDKQQRCNQTQVEDPLLEPPKVSGSFQKYTEEATVDRHGDPIVTSSFEMLRGPNVEFDKNRPSVHIEMNVASFDTVALAYSMIDTVNDATLWGFPKRCVKLTNAPWSRKFYGQCNVYYTLTLEFDTRQDVSQVDGATLGFDREVLDEGNKVLSGKWDATTGRWTDVLISGATPDYNNPTHFVKFQDRNGNFTKVLHDYSGRPAEALYGAAVGSGSTNEINYIKIEKYNESNFLLLGIPTQF